VAIAVAQAASGFYKDGLWFVALSSLTDPTLLPSALTAALGIAQSGVNLVSGLTGWLRDKVALIVLDSCEHVIAAAAKIVEEILRAARNVSILATSREPLRAEGEWIHRLGSLRVPPDSGELGIEDVLHYSAVELFTERALAVADQLSFDRGELAAVVEICRRLDGMPLALELAAAQVDVFGVKGLAGHLDDRFTILTKGRRTALPRHQTLRATIDWSYDLLPETEQRILARLAVFQGDFTMDGAAAVVTDDQFKPADVFEGIANLAMKSLVTTDISGEPTHHRLLDTTRAYALEKLIESGEVERVKRLHANYYRDLFEQAEAEWETRPTAEWLADYRRQIDDLRAALDWAFAPRGDASVGVALAVAVVPLWVQLSLMRECRRRVEQALTSLAPSANRGTPQEMRLYAALGASLIYTRGSATETGVAWANALEIAERLGDTEFQLRALRGLWTYRMENGEYRAALTLAQRFHSLAATQIGSVDLPVGERMIGNSLHYLGDQSNARHHIECALRGYITSAPRQHITHYQFDQRVTARATLARILWLQGLPDQAMRSALTSVEEAHASEHVLSLCNALVRAVCPIALWVGDLATAERSIAMLLDYSGRHGLALWQIRARGFKGMLMNRTGEIGAGLQLLGAALEELRRTPKYGGPHYAAFLGTFAEALGGAGRAAEGLVAIDEAIARSERTELRMSVPELLRVRGKLLLSEGGSRAAASAEDYFRRALELARRQGALSWELRTATSLARHWRNQDHRKEARELLAPIHNRFTEGFATADLQEARSLLEQLS
jgi:predicted ATPase